jgi:hypothetical protein
MFDSNKKRLINTKSQAPVPSLHSGQAETNSKHQIPMTKTHKTNAIPSTLPVILSPKGEESEPMAQRPFTPFRVTKRLMVTER